MADLPFIDLFHHLRAEKMMITLDQYDLLQQALDQGYGLKGWEDLRRLCHVLWVKPCPGYDRDLFDRIFDQYVRQLHRHWQAELAAEVPLPEAPDPPEDKPVLPSVPPRRMPANQPTAAEQAPIAVKTAPPDYGVVSDSDFQLTPRQLPVPLETVRGSWRVLRQLIREGKDSELDLDGTIARINREGVFDQVVFRSTLVQRAELVVLIDDGEAMVPFQPAIQPLITAVEEQRVSPAHLYRFTVFPDDYLYQWRQPTKAVPLVSLLSRWHQSRTIVWVVSDAGAAASTYSPERLRGIVEFLVKIQPCIRELLWINPLPSDRWLATTATAIAQVLDGRMIALDPFSLQRAAREPISSLMFKVWSLPLRSEQSTI
jgi:hypothetical protein